MNPYLLIFLIIATVTFLPLIVLCVLRAIALCKLREGKYDEEER